MAFWCLFDTIIKKVNNINNILKYSLFGVINKKLI